MKSIIYVISVFLIVESKQNLGNKKRINTAKCKYTFIINELDSANCLNTLAPLQSDREQDSYINSNPRVFLNPSPRKAETNSREVKVWLHELEKQLYNESKKGDVINTTLFQHELSISKTEKVLTEYQSNFSAIFRMLHYLESSLQQQNQLRQNLDKKLSDVMLDVLEVNNVLSKKVVAAAGSQLTFKEILVQSVSQVTSCSVSQEAVINRDCADIQRRHKLSGVYYITPSYAPCPIPVWCDMDTTLGGWLLVLKRHNGNVDFKRMWDDYKHGFGDIIDEFYLGNDNIFLLTNQKHYELRIDLWDFQENRVYALYKTFRIDGERDNYKLNIHGFEGSAHDSFHNHDRSMFSTPDRDNDGYKGYNCAKEWMAGWWFNNCWFAFLTGPYYNISNVKYRGISWNEWKHEQLAKVEMKIRPSRITPHDSEHN